jgi:uncharacterized repeat protein (TIGR03803 family)
MKNPSRFFVLAYLLAVAFFFAAVATQAQTYTVLYTFEGGKDGASPLGSLLRDGAGNLFGTADNGGTHTCLGQGCGVVFKLSSSGNQSVLLSFTGASNGAGPFAGMIADSQGNLYGTTDVGGGRGCSSTRGCGTVFKLTTSSSYTLLHAFQGGSDGIQPMDPLVRDSAGNLYGTAHEGGSNYCDGYPGCGIVFKLDSSGAETILHVFTGGTDGALPYSGVVRDSLGNLYGTTLIGGSSDNGTVFKIDPAGVESILYTFTGGADGGSPYQVILDSHGNLYGTANNGGDRSCVSYGCGVVFKLDPSGTEIVLHTFQGGASDGSGPVAGVIRDAAGNLFGTTERGGASGVGTVYKLDPAGELTLLHSFSGASDGSSPNAGLIRDSAGNLYGVTAYGGDLSKCDGQGCGVVFKITP